MCFWQAQPKSTFSAWISWILRFRLIVSVIKNSITAQCKYKQENDKKRDSVFFVYINFDRIFAVFSVFASGFSHNSLFSLLTWLLYLICFVQTICQLRVLYPIAEKEVAFLSFPLPIFSLFLLDFTMNYRVFFSHPNMPIPFKWILFYDNLFNRTNVISHFITNNQLFLYYFIEVEYTQNATKYSHCLC